jgi:hypothetical protein
MKGGKGLNVRSAVTQTEAHLLSRSTIHHRYYNAIAGPASSGIEAEAGFHLHLYYLLLGG